MDIKGLSKIQDMAKVGYFGQFLIKVNSDDGGSIPHVHIVDVNTQGAEFHCCVMLSESRYFSHTGKEYKLNSRQRKAFYEFMQSPPLKSRFNVERSNYEKACRLWEDNNSDAEVSINYADDGSIIIPDYREIKDYK